MIKFIPVNLDTETKNIHTIMNKGLAIKLTDMYGNKKCPTDPYHQSVCYIDLSKGEDQYLIIDKVCCDTIKKFLTLLSQNKAVDFPE